jgi:hypothetical protein
MIMQYGFIVLLAMCLMGPQLACGGVRPSASGGYRIQLEDVHGNQLNTYNQAGATYVLGQYGGRYNIRVFNQTNQRIEAVVTVDGRDAISGDLGDYVAQRGYVVDPYESVLVEGFRRSLSHIAAFRFTNPGDSYAGRRGSAHNVGVVGVAIFKERRHAYRSKKKSMAHKNYRRHVPSASGSAQGRHSELDDRDSRRTSRSPTLGGHHHEKRNNLGTRFGENRNSNAVEVPFKRASSRHPSRVIALYYDNRAGLVSRGIDFGRSQGEPDPFPRRHFAPSPY